MTATILSLRRPARMECSGCGATADAACDCGVAYMPAGEIAAKARAENPSKSSRALATELGVSEATMRRAKPSPASYDAPEKRVGRDGKSYPARKPPQASDPIQETCDDCDTPEQHWQRSLGNLAGDAISMSAYWSRQFGKWQRFDVPSSLVSLVEQAAKAWSELASNLAKKRSGK